MKGIARLVGFSDKEGLAPPLQVTFPMKKLVEEVSNEGLESLLGETVMVWCLNFIYRGKLIGVNDKDILLTDASVVYETGGLCDKEPERQEPLPHNWYVRTSCIESYGKVA